MKEKLIETVKAQMQSATGKNYDIDLRRMDTYELREMIRFIDDVEFLHYLKERQLEKKNEASRARITFRPLV